MRPKGGGSFHGQPLRSFVDGSARDPIVRHRLQKPYLRVVVPRVAWDEVVVHGAGQVGGGGGCGLA
jgi:hypothetical protein